MKRIALILLSLLITMSIGAEVVMYPMPQVPVAGKHADQIDFERSSTKEIASFYRRLPDFEEMYQESQRNKEQFKTITRGDKIRVFGLTDPIKESENVYEFVATFIDSCEGAYVVATPGGVSAWAAQEVLKRFPEVYKKTHALTGKPDYDVDGNEKILILIYEMRSAAGFVGVRDILPVWGKSNGMETIHLDPRGILMNRSKISTLLAHEFHHVVKLGYDFFETPWMLEGLAEESAHMVAGYSPKDYGEYDLFLEAWKWDFGYYNSAHRFIKYLKSYFGDKIFKRLTQDSKNGIESVQQQTGMGWEEILAVYKMPVNPFSYEGGGISASIGSAPNLNIEQDICLLQNSPNPFNSDTTIRFQIAQPGIVELEIYNVLGQQVRVLQSGYLNAGPHVVQWNGQDAVGRPVASGVYVYRLSTQNKTLTKRMSLVK